MASGKNTNTTMNLEDDSSENASLKLKHKKNFNLRAFGVEDFTSSYQSEIQDLERVGLVLSDQKNCTMLTKERYNETLEIMKKWNTSDINFKKQNHSGYKYMKCFECATTTNDNGSINETLFKKTKSEPKRVLHEEEVFDIISMHHEQYGHRKARGMHNDLKKKYANISEVCLKLFVETCPVCNEESKNRKKHKGARSPISSSHFRDRFQVDLIDYQKDPQPDGNGNIMKWLLVLKDHHTKLIYLRAISTKVRITCHTFQYTSVLALLFQFLQIFHIACCFNSIGS